MPPPRILPCPWASGEHRIRGRLNFWQARALNQRSELVDTVAGKKLRIRFDPAHGTAEAMDEQGKPWPGTMAYWFAWVAFHPKTEVLHVP